MDSDVVPPRLAVHLVPWLRSWRSGLVPVDDLLAAVTDTPMRGIEQVVVVDGIGVDLATGLAGLSRTPADEIRLVLPVPGDLRGLPTSGEFAAAALTCGEAVVAGDCGLVPQPRTHTSGSGDTWHTVSWLRHDLPVRPKPVDEPTVADADLALSEALRDATGVLTRLDVAAWNPQLDRALTRMRAPSGRQLPPGFDNRSRRLFDRATLLDTALRVAESDAMGGAVTSYEASARREALRPLAAACRQALLAACHARLG